MGNLLGRDKPLKEVLRENKRMVNRAVRELDREKNALEREEQRLTIEIKKAAKENQMQAVKIMAKVPCSLFIQSMLFVFVGPFWPGVHCTAADIIQLTTLDLSFAT